MEKTPRPETPGRRLGAAVRRRRKALRLSQLDLCRYAGCGLAFLYDLERGKPSVRLDKVLDVLQVLGVELRLADGKGGIVVVARDLQGQERQP
ncbi:MAG: helix-turn-helix transcriptional regulator [Myxococcales bacterium]|nr:helix-turn-helix transcriptional regulator [Myxococcales bacterium]